MEGQAEAVEGTDPGGAAWSRRAFVGGMLASGFALAAQPVAADTTVHTGTEGLVAGEVAIAVGDLQVPAYRAAPAGAGSRPVVLVVQEIFGVHEHIRDVCRRLAHAGYFALAPELYFRQGDVGRARDREEILQIVGQVADAQVMGDLDAALAWARAQGADTARAAITGFCWGGRITWLYCLHNPALRAGVAWYGKLVGPASARQPQHPAELAGALRVPVLGLYGGADASIPLDSVERMRTALAGGASGSEIVVYPAAPHAFFADYRPSYREEPARDGWARLLRWLADHGAA